MTLKLTSDVHKTMLIVLAMLKNMEIDTKIIRISQGIPEILLF